MQFMREIKTFCDWHLGDNLIHLNFFRRLAVANENSNFIHAAPAEQVWQLKKVVSDLGNCRVVDSRSGDGWIDSWKNADNFFTGHPLMGKFTAFHIEHFNRLSGKLGFESPIKCSADMIFDYPALWEEAWSGREYDYLFVNSRPMSGQLCSYKEGFFGSVIDELVQHGKRVAVTQDDGHKGTVCTKPLSVSEVGNLSIRCANIIGVATGPIWTTFNVRSKPKLRIVCLDNNEQLDLTSDIIQCQNISQVRAAIGKI
jgi:hypothetical protein